MAKRNEYSYSKRQREIKKRKKQEEKRALKAARKAGTVPGDDPEATESAPATPDEESGTEATSDESETTPAE